MLKKWEKPELVNINTVEAGKNTNATAEGALKFIVSRMDVHITRDAKTSETTHGDILANGRHFVIHLQTTKQASDPAGRSFYTIMFITNYQNKSSGPS